MRVIVCGGRDYKRTNSVWNVLYAIHAVRKISVIVHGACRGADTLAKHWAEAEKVKHEPHIAMWLASKKAAGAMRNAEMAALGADLCIAFPGDTGTADMVEKAKAAGIQVLDLRTPDQTALDFGGG